MICEKCGQEMECGYGLAGGGIGPYFYCETEGCDGFKKFQDTESATCPKCKRTRNDFDCAEDECPMAAATVEIKT